jgi:carboxynorspermidine decarboxylase
VISCGLRINPEYSEVEVDLYNPCASNSRLGIRRPEFEGQNLAGIEGLHFHTMCEQGAGVLERTLEVVEEKFGSLFDGMRWANFGGGHHITRPGYDLDLLCSVVNGFRARHPHLQVYLEPGEAIGLNTGVLVTTVQDIVPGPIPVAILDCSASAHMPDVLEMPYRPELIDGADPGQLAHTYRLGGMTCLAGDVIGDWSFAEPLEVGRRLVFKDMAHYTMVKTTMFNGVRHPAIVFYHEDRDEVEVVREFGYEDYKRRLS